jgi:hypothetical protein
MRCFAERAARAAGIVQRVEREFGEGLVRMRHERLLLAIVVDVDENAVSAGEDVAMRPSGFAVPAHRAV